MDFHGGVCGVVSRLLTHCCRGIWIGAAVQACLDGIHESNLTGKRSQVKNASKNAQKCAKINFKGEFYWSLQGFKIISGALARVRF